MDKLKENFLENITYETHPAFANIQNSRFDEEEIKKSIASIDSLYENLIIKKKELFSENNLPKELSIEIDNLKKLLEDGNCPSDYTKIIIQDLKKQLCFHSKYFFETNNFNPDFIEDTPLLEQFKNDGCVSISLSNSERSKLERLGQKYLIKCRERVEGRTDFRGGIALHYHHEISKVIRDIVKTNNIEQLISNYKNTTMKLCYIALDYSNQGQTWFKDCYSDIGLDLPKTNYFHFDNDIEVSKALVNLTDVCIDNGPFTFVRGSNNWNFSMTLMCIYSSIDRGINAKLFKENRKSNYYRPLFKEFREELVKLPKIMQGSTHFGDDILDETPLSDLLLDNSIVFTGAPGQFIVFDGYRGIHKGSTCTKGERLGLQIGFISTSSPHYNKPTIQSIVQESIIGKLIALLKGKKLSDL